jgi:glycogen operon protein
MNHWKPEWGLPFPWGATWDEERRGFNFALCSPHATSVALELYRHEDFETPLVIRHLDPWREKTTAVWHCFIPEIDLRGAEYYAYRVDGPRDPVLGHRFDSDKVLLDPWARRVLFPPRHSRAAACRPGPNAGQAPLGCLLKPQPFDWSGDQRVRHYHDLIIYELHVRGFTRHPSSGVPDHHRGTYLGVIDRIPYLRALGVTAVELMPVQQYDPEEGNYWGYMTLNFFAPHAAYSATGDAITEFKTMVRELHRAGIEVILDVVYNHTTEGPEFGPTYSFRGIDNAVYYLLDARGRYNNDSGCGNVLKSSSPVVRKLILDSLRYWVQEMHVDGFRFDLASIFTRNADGTVNLHDPPILSEITTDPILQGARLIAEPWDIASYHAGIVFPGIGWMQWNGKFRDDVRKFLRGDEDQIGPLMTRLYGSSDLFPDTLPYSCRPHMSVNFVTAHDGFTLYDLVSYNEKHNRANGEGNRDGCDHNFSWNCGHEGDEGAAPEVLRLRERQVRNFLVILMISNGVPMLRMGDEFLHTQKGNNNAFNQDNPLSWIHWDDAERHAGFLRFTRLLIAYRRRATHVARGTFWRDAVHWLGPEGPIDFEPESQEMGFALAPAPGGERWLLAMINGHKTRRTFRLPSLQPQPWRRIVDTARPSPEDILELHESVPVGGPSVDLESHSIVLLVSEGM